MEKCPKCGNKLSNVDVLCPRCGALVEVVQFNSSFIPSTSRTSVPSATESPSQSVPSESFLDEDFFSNAFASQSFGSKIAAQPETSEPETVIADSEPLELIQDTSPEQPAYIMPDLSDMMLPGLDVDGASSGGIAPTEFASPEIKHESASTPEPETRMARRARERGRIDAPDFKVEKPETAEEKLLKEADELTSRASLRASRSAASLEYDEGRKSVLRAISDDSADAAEGDMSAPDSVSDEEPRRYRSRERRSSSIPATAATKKMPVLASVLLWVMLAAVVFTGFYYLNRYVQNEFGGYPAFIRDITNGKIELDPNATLASSITVATEQTTTDNGAPAHTFTVSAINATEVRVTQTGDSFPMTDGKAVFTLPDEKIAQALGVVTYNSTVSADALNLDITFTSASQSYTVEPFELRLIRSVYSREAPTEMRTTTSENVIELIITVAPESTVFINNVNYSDALDFSGKLKTDLKLEEVGDNIFVIDVIQPGRQAVKDSLTIIHEAAQTALVPEAGYKRIFAPTFECRGTSEAGATLSAEMNGKTFAGLVSESGAFSAACTAGEYGLYTVKLTAAIEGKVNNVAEVSVEYLPNFNDISAKAKKKSVAEVIKNATTLANADITLVGKPTELTTEDIAQNFSLVSGSSKLNCYFYGDAPKLAEGSEYTLYGRLDETGQFYVMYVE